MTSTPPSDETPPPNDPVPLADRAPGYRQAAAKVREFPQSPGVYLIKDAAGLVIYVGKAVNRRSRAGSYFLKAAAEDRRTAELVREISDIDYLDADSECIRPLDDAALKAKTAEFKAALASGKAPEDIMPEAFAVARRESPWISVGPIRPQVPGGFTDGAENYRRGDVAGADPSVHHRPVADPDGACICLIVTEGKLRFSGLFGPLLTYFRG